MTDEQWAKLEPLARAKNVAEAAYQRALAQEYDLKPAEKLEHGVQMARLMIEQERARRALWALETEVLGA